MATNSAEQFQIPPDMRAIAEKSVEHAKQAIEGFISAAHRTVGVLEGQAETARKGAKDVGEKAMNFAERNITSSCRSVARPSTGASAARANSAHAAVQKHSAARSRRA